MKNSLKDRYIGLLEIGNKKIRKKKKKKEKTPIRLFAYFVITSVIDANHLKQELEKKLAI